MVALALTLARTGHIGFVGYDNYPILIASRIASWCDFVGTFTERLMDGRYPGDFYRPLLNLTFAADHAVWGLRPWGYQLTNALAFVMCAWAVHVLARRVEGDGRAHWLAPFVFLWHPSAVAVVPSAARRSETLCGAFLALSLAVALGEGSWRRRSLAAGGLTLAAIGAKETGFLAPLLAFGVVWICAHGPVAARTGRAVRRALPHAGAAALMMAVRLAVLGHVGGHRQSGLTGGAGRELETLRWIVGRLVVAPGDRAPWLPTVLAAVAIAGLVLLLLRPRSHVAAEAPASTAGALRLIACGLSWLVLSSLPYAFAGRVAPWYELLPAMGWALALAGIAGLAAAAWQPGRPARQRLGVAVLLLWVVGVTAQARSGLWMTRLDRWREASEDVRGFLEELEAGIAATPDGHVLEARPLIRRRRATGPDGSTGDATYLITGYSIEAWAELKFPERRIRVRDLWTEEREARRKGRVPPSRPPAAAPGELLVVLPTGRQSA